MYQQRITASQLQAHYRDADAAMVAGDFATALRMNGGDAEVAGICRVMLGNQVAGTEALDRVAAPMPRARLISAVGHWLLGHDQVADERLAGVPDGAAKRALASAMGIARPRIAFFSGTEKLVRFVEAVRNAAVADLVTIGHRPDLVDVPITPATDPAELVAAVGPVDALYIDNLTILPPQLAAIDAPKICHFYDLEHTYAARGQDVGWIDWLVAIASGEHLESQLRFGRPCLGRGFGLTDTWPDLGALSGLADHGAARRPIDVLFTGGIDMPFYPDKRQRLAALAQMPAGRRIEIYGKMLDRHDYFDLLAGSKLVFSSTRSPNCTPRRLVEALAHGACVICEDDSSIGLLLDTDLPVFHHFAPDRIGRDVEAALDRYADCLARVEADQAGFDRLIAQMPTTDRSAREFARYVTLLGQMSKSGVSWPAFMGAEEDESAQRYDAPPVRGVYAAKHNPIQAYQPALRRALLTPLAEGDDVPYDERLVALASLAIWDRQEHLLRRQVLGRRKAACALMTTLNRARRRNPRSLQLWVHIAEFLVDTDRLALASRVIARIEAQWQLLERDRRSILVMPAYEFNDFGFVDRLIASDLAARWPDTFAPPAISPERQLQAHLAWLSARIAQQRGDVDALGLALDRMLLLGADDPWAMEQVMMMATAGLKGADPRRFLRLICLAFARGSRLCPRFLSLHFPLAIQVLMMLERTGLARILLKRFLFAKARVRLGGAEVVATDPERQMLASFGPAIRDAIARIPAEHMRATLMAWLAAAPAIACPPAAA